ncbi:MAG: metal-sensing transcriptional repressor [Candidatus Aenigmarchaeota archaeon]|nr:metal-sensing transcriptional repressor [Candidatus Aenigmarchaeota archaeon]NIT04621.1 metal-sensing transcriptional repressor [Candidatus Saccharibacteria bacterium]
MVDKRKKGLLNRMNYLAGHLQAVSRMIEEDRYCIDIIRQNQAVVSALEKVNKIILHNHLETCVTKAIKGKSEKEKKKAYREIIEVFEEK